MRWMQTERQHGEAMLFVAIKVISLLVNAVKCSPSIQNLTLENNQMQSQCWTLTATGSCSQWCVGVLVYTYIFLLIYDHSAITAKCPSVSTLTWAEDQTPFITGELCRWKPPLLSLICKILCQSEALQSSLWSSPQPHTVAGASKTQRKSLSLNLVFIGFLFY